MRMRYVCMIALVSACAPSDRPAPAASVGGEHVTEAKPPAPAAPKVPSEDELTAQVHALFDAYDRDDDAAFAAQVSPGFALYESGAVQDLDAVLAQLRARRARQAPVRARTWDGERVRVSGDVAVFSGDSIEHLPAQSDRKARNFAGWNTVVLVREGAAFRPVHWTWQVGGIEGARVIWNEVYRDAHWFNEKPNALLVETVRGRKPGRALDVACGEGRNAVYLATQGWKVTGVDISDVALRLAREQASRRKVPLELVDADVETWDFGDQQWDLVSLVYAGPALNVEALHKVHASLRHGGLVVVEGFASPPDATAPDATVDGQLSELFREGFDILRDDIVEDMPDWGTTKTKLVRFVARKR